MCCFLCNKWWQLTCCINPQNSAILQRMWFTDSAAKITRQHWPVAQWYFHTVPIHPWSTGRLLVDEPVLWLPAFRLYSDLPVGDPVYPECQLPFHTTTRKPSWRKSYAWQQFVYTAILDFWNSKVPPECTISSAVPENHTLEPNSTSIGKSVAKLWPFLYIQDGHQPPSWILSNRK